MSLPYSAALNQPQGFGIATVGAVTYLVDNVVNATKNEGREISRETGKGDRADFLVRAGGEPVVVEFTFQRALASTPPPVDSTLFLYDHNGDGVESYFVTLDTKTQKGQEGMDQFTTRAVLLQSPPPLEDVVLSMDYSIIHAERTTIGWSYPAGVVATDVEVWDNSDIQVGNTVDTLKFHVTPPAQTSGWVEDYFASLLQVGEQWGTVAVRYTAENGQKSGFTKINFTMPGQASGLYEFFPDRSFDFTP